MNNLRTGQFDYSLPEELIAQMPCEPRDHCGLMVYDTAKDEVFHRRFYEIGDFLDVGDCLVVNRSKVIPARLCFGGKEVFILKSLGSGCFHAMVRPGKFFSPGKVFNFGEAGSLEVQKVLDDGTRVVFFENADVVKRFGLVPLPPYIKNSTATLEQYQTVFAKEEGSVAAPTAGLHFTADLFNDLRHSGIGFEEVVLHVGRGTFLPVTSELVEDHVMHKEFFELSAEAAMNLSNSKRVIAVGTTSVRVLESCFDGNLKPGIGETDIFIYPGNYRWKVVDGLVTNFHLPKSSLMMLVASFLEHKGVKDPVEKLLRLYDTAIANKYRFYSFGDAMLIL